MTDLERKAIVGKLGATKALMSMLKNLQSAADDFEEMGLLSEENLKSINETAYSLYSMLAKTETEQLAQLRLLK